MTDTTIPIDSLPKRLREAADLIGVPAAMRLAEAYGGRRLYVPLPENCRAQHPLAQLLGLDALLRLAEIWGGQEHFEVPCGVQVLRLRRDAALVAAHAAGESLRSLAARFCISERQVVRICQRLCGAGGARRLHGARHHSNEGGRAHAGLWLYAP